MFPKNELIDSLSNEDIQELEKELSSSENSVVKVLSFHEQSRLGTNIFTVSLLSTNSNVLTYFNANSCLQRLTLDIYSRRELSKNSRRLYELLKMGPWFTYTRHEIQKIRDGVFWAGKKPEDNRRFRTFNKSFHAIRHSSDLVGKTIFKDNFQPSLEELSNNLSEIISCPKDKRLSKMAKLEESCIKAKKTVFPWLKDIIQCD